MLPFLLEYVVGHGDDLDGLDDQTRLFEGLAGGAGGEFLAVFEMSAWELHGSCIYESVSVFLYPIMRECRGEGDGQVGDSPEPWLPLRRPTRSLPWGSTTIAAMPTRGLGRVCWEAMMNIFRSISIWLLFVIEFAIFSRVCSVRER